MAPEQMEKPETVDHRADIYSLGVVIFEMLTGDVPMGHFELPSQKAQLDVRLDKIVLHAMERDAERRYQHASEIKTDVENVTSKPGAQVSPPAATASVPVADAGGTRIGPSDWKPVPQPAATTRFLRAMLWLVTITGAVMFLWFDSITYYDTDSQTTVRIGAVQPWLVVRSPHVSYAPNFLTVSGFAGLFAVIAAIALVCFRQRGTPNVAQSGGTDEPRLSRCALIGAIWTALGLVAGLIVFTAFFLTTGTELPPLPDHVGEMAPSPPDAGRPFWLYFVAIPFGLIAATAPFGTTILGAVAIGQIKRSAGKLYGLPLAFADAMLFPLFLVSTASALIFIETVFILFGVSLPKLGGVEGVVLPGLPALAVCFFVGRAAWWRVTGTSNNSKPWKIPLFSAEPLMGKAALVIALSAAIAHAHPWFRLISAGDGKMVTYPNGDLMEAKQSLLLVLIAIGAALFAAAPGLTLSVKKSLRGLGAASLILALTVQGRFLSSLSEWEPGHEGTVARITRTYPNTAIYVTLALTALGLLFFVLRFFEEKSTGSPPVESELPRDSRSGVRTPAETLLLVAGIALLTALGIGGWLWAVTALHPESNFRPEHGQQGFAMIAMAVVIAGYGFFISAAGLLMRRLRGRMFVLICLVLVGLFIPAALALNCIQEANNIPQWPVLLPLWLGMPVCLWAALVLFREDVRAAFVAVVPTGSVVGAWTTLEIATVAATALAFVLGGINSLFDLVKNASPLHTVTLSAIILAAVCAGALLVAQQFRTHAGTRAALPELCVATLAACTGGLPWTQVFSEITGWNFWHGAAFAALNFVLAHYLLITFGKQSGQKDSLAVLLIGLAGLGMVLWWNAVPVGLIGDRGGFLGSGSSPLTITRKPVNAGAYTAAALAVLTALTGALRLRAVLAGREA